MHRVRTRIPVKDEGGPTKSIPVIRVLLRNIQRSDLNLLAAYRKIPILGAPPSSVVHAREDASKSIDEVLRLLQNLESARAEGDRARIAALGPSDTPLALVREHLPLRGSFGIALRERTRFPVRSVRCAAPLTVDTVSGTSCRSSE